MTRYRVATIRQDLPIPIVEDKGGIFLVTDPEGWHRLEAESLDELDEAFIAKLMGEPVTLSEVKETPSDSFFDWLS